jgi:flagellar biosynthesis/type III secretory pathway protein FliH
LFLVAHLPGSRATVNPSLCSEGSMTALSYTPHELAVLLQELRDRVWTNSDFELFMQQSGLQRHVDETIQTVLEDELSGLTGQLLKEAYTEGRGEGYGAAFDDGRARGFQEGYAVGRKEGESHE